MPLSTHRPGATRGPAIFDADWDPDATRPTEGAIVTVRASWNGSVVAESDETVIVEGNHYFPLSSVQQDYLQPSDTHTVCPWKGTASYYSLKIGDEVNTDAAWFYPEPKDAAKEITDHVAFWRGVTIEAN
jgi:uncharacterized protein (DUF427 family)